MAAAQDGGVRQEESIGVVATKVASATGESVSVTCRDCGRTLDCEAIFCPSCLVQARCKSCREPLRPDARGCTRCGTAIEVARSVLREDVEPTAVMNTFEFVETSQRRELRA